MQGVVHPDERSAANGVTNVARSLGASTGPYLAGLLYADAQYMNYPWIIAGVLKLVYDFLLLYNMHSVKPDNELPSKVEIAVGEEDSIELRGDIVLGAEVHKGEYVKLLHEEMKEDLVDEDLGDDAA